MQTTPAHKIGTSPRARSLPPPPVMPRPVTRRTVRTSMAHRVALAEYRAAVTPSDRLHDEAARWGARSFALAAISKASPELLSAAVVSCGLVPAVSLRAQVDRACGVKL